MQTHDVRVHPSKAKLMPAGTVTAGAKGIF